MDIYILFCFIMVFLAFVEFAFISFIGIFIARLKMTDLVRVMTLRQMTRCPNIALQPNLALKPNLAHNSNLDHNPNLVLKLSASLHILKTKVDQPVILTSVLGLAEWHTLG